MKDGIEMNDITDREYEFEIPEVQRTPVKSATILVNMTLWNQIHNKLKEQETALRKISDRCCEPCCIYADEALGEKK
jgi:hypothetical protein